MNLYSLGRLVEHDERSRAFACVVPKTAVRKSVLWEHTAPVLDQGKLGSCTGNAMAQLLNSALFSASRVGDAYLDEAEAVRLYSRATTLDRFKGSYPPQDTGSSGLGVAKAAKGFGYITSYRHAFGFEPFCQAVQSQPVLVGTKWTTGMYSLNARGYARSQGEVVGGHEYLCIGIDYSWHRLTFLNSWGPSWGRNGRFHMSFAEFSGLLADDGDATVPLL